MINRKIAISAVSIFAAFALVAGGTLAFFTDSASSVGNTFTTGNADLQIAVDNTNTPGTYGNTIPGFSATGIVPGFTDDYVFWLKNNSSAGLSLDLTGDLANLGGAFHGSDGSLPNKLFVKFTCDTDGNGFGTGTDTATGELSVTDWINGGTASLGSLASSGQVQCSMSVRLDENAGNEIKGSDVSFDGKFDATQTP